MKSSTALIALLVALAVLSTLGEARELTEKASYESMIEGLQAAPAKKLRNYYKCAVYCKYTKGCVAWSFNTNPNIHQCRVFKCVNEVQPNPDWVSEILYYVNCDKYY